MLDALERLWENMTLRRMYVSGGVGSRWEGEAFGEDFELPNSRAYTETCAAIASVMWNFRLLGVTGNARYADLMEWTLYNAVLPGLSLDGEEYFYQNPLADDGAHRRQAWFGCACCPPNVARLLASLPGYFYGTEGNALWLHLYAQGAVTATLENGQRVRLEQTTRYPWDGEVTLRVGAQGAYALKLRVPDWAEGASVQVNDEAGRAVTAGAYAELRRDWQQGDTVRLGLPMPVRYLEAHPYVTENLGRVALARGPLLYCAEGIDHDADVRDLYVPDRPEGLKLSESEDLGGALLLSGEAVAAEPEGAYLYRTVTDKSARAKPVTLTAVPYYAWANRAASPMQVWLRRR